MSRKSRLEKAEQRTGGELPFLPLYQDLDDPDLFHTNSQMTKREAEGDTIYTSAQVAELSKTHMIFKVVYDKNWKGAGDQAGEW